MNKKIKLTLICLFFFIGGLFTCSQILVMYDKERASSLFFVGVQYYENKEYEKAVALFNQSLAMNPDYYAAYHLLGEIYYKKGEIDMAREMLMVAKEKVRPGNDVDKKRIVELLSHLAEK